MIEPARFNSRVLIVEDDIKNIQVLGTLLSQAGYHINVAQNGSEALETAREVVPDLILLDIMMPEPDGFEVCRQLKSISETKDIPIIFMTARSDTDDIVRGFETGAVDYITKPFNSVEVLARVNTQLTLRRQLKNIIEKKEMEVAMDMSAGIAHEFNNQLYIVRARIDLMREKNSRDQAFLKDADQVFSATDRMLNLVKSLLRHTSQFHFRPENVLLNPFIQDTVDVMKGGMGNEISVETCLSPHVGKVNIDVENLRLALSEILKNSVEAVESTGAITVSTEIASEKMLEQLPDFEAGHMQYVWLGIRDTHGGMDTQTKNKIFKPFFTTKFLGRGMGMAAAYGIIRKHGGDIWVESVPGLGTTVHILLPAVDA